MTTAVDPRPGIPTDMCRIVHCVDRATWLDERRKRIQASDCAAVLQQSQWGSPLTVWTDKTSPLVLNPASERQRIGLGLEGAICEMYAEKFGGTVERWPAWTIAASREHGFLGATPDALVEDESRTGTGLLEIKTASEYSRKDWEESIPMPYQIQVQAALFVTGLQWAAVAVLIGVQTIERIYVERNEWFIAAMLPVLRDFWTLVELRQMPPTDSSEATRQALARLHPKDSGAAIALPDEAEGVVCRWQRIKSLVRLLKEHERGCENWLKAHIGDATYGVTPSNQWLSLKTSDRAGYSVAATSYRSLKECAKPPKGIEVSEARQQLITNGAE